MNNDPIEMREAILTLVLELYHSAAAANGWDEAPPNIEAVMDEIFRLVTVGLNITE